MKKRKVLDLSSSSGLEIALDRKVDNQDLFVCWLYCTMRKGEGQLLSHEKQLVQPQNPWPFATLERNRVSSAGQWRRSDVDSGYQWGEGSVGRCLNFSGLTTISIS